jgi:predicted RNA-binding Zn-ribbon protein involved in translation (DUF1610 family)
LRNFLDVISKRLARIETLDQLIELIHTLASTINELVGLLCNFLLGPFLGVIAKTMLATNVTYGMSITVFGLTLYQIDCMFGRRDSFEESVEAVDPVLPIQVDHQLVRFHCPNCLTKISAGPEFFGTSAPCPTCGQPIQVPFTPNSPSPIVNPTE